MLRTEPMTKVRAVFLEQNKPEVIRTLHGLGVIDFRKSKLSLIDDTPLMYYQQIYDALIKFEGALALIPKQATHKRIEHMPLKRLLKEAAHNRAVEKIYALADMREQLMETQKKIEYAQKVAALLFRVGVSPEALNSSSVKFEAYIGNAKEISAMNEILAKEKGVATKYYLEHGVGFLLVAFEADRETVVEACAKAQKKAPERLDLKAEYIEGNDPKKLVKELGKRSAENERRIDEIERNLAREGAKSYANIAAMTEMLHIELDRANASSMFKKTESTALLEGWIPSKQYVYFEKALLSATKNNAYIEKMQDDELAPTLLNRPKILKPFDFGMEFFSLPRSDEIDPTWFFIGSFLIFYGFMVSDVGYALLSFLLASWIARITNPNGLTHNAAKVWQLGAIPAAVFGVITNQYFGLKLDQYFMPFAGIDWLKSITVFLAISIIMGITEIVIGLVFGFINRYRRGEKLKAYSKLTGIATILLGTFFVAGAFFGVMGSLAMPFGIGALIALIATVVLGGSEGSEAMSLITHTLSYARIMGFGLTSVMIAFLINTAFTPTLANGIPMFILLIIVFLVLHTLNMIVSMFEGIVQGVRLNIVEFFTKFYYGGGIKFMPFGYKRLLTKE
ncbi:MAG: V-type ATPase 116kDa subunit family protein [Candidatus Micrarchaeaceae archaeon]